MEAENSALAHNYSDEKNRERVGEREGGRER